MFYHNENAKLGTDNNTKLQWQKFDCCCCLPQEWDSIFSHKFHVLAINCESGARVHLKERKQQKSLVKIILKEERDSLNRQNEID